MAGPYAAALPAVSGHVPVLFAIPGNHDWYDGLTSFTRQFCQRRTIGAWQTEQFRSYFAAKLIRNWWIWGIDIQLGSDIDYPQLRYFRDTDRREVDFVVVERRAPQLFVECKWGDTEVDRGLRYLKARFPKCEAWQISAAGTKDYVTPDDIRVAPAMQLLRGFV